MRLGPPLKISEWAGYNNQPSFLPDGRGILYTSIRDNQADTINKNTRRGKALPHWRAAKPPALCPLLNPRRPLWPR
jgi:hypothetical protein